jgi:8-oxo-dGTP diphosphatase
MTSPRAGIDYIGVGVGACIFNDQGRMLLSLRGEKARNESGKWEIPGGAVEFGETFEDAIIREVKEEIDVTIVVKQLLQVVSHILPEEKQHWVSPTYICQIIQGTPRIVEPEKSTELRWCSIEEAQDLPLSIVTQHDIDFLINHPELIPHQ